MSGKCIIFSAPSGSGKTTIVKHLLSQTQLNLEFSVSATSRKPRGEEKNGVDYFYLTIDEFRKKIRHDAFIEWEEVYEGIYYGTLKEEIQRIWSKGNHVVFDVDVAGGLNLKKIFGESALLIFVMPPSIRELERRLKQRSTDDEDTIKMRIAKAEKELSFASQFDVQLVNDKLEHALVKAFDIVANFTKK